MSRFRYSNCWDIKQLAKGESMPLKKISNKEWIKLGLPASSTFLHIGPYYIWDNVNKIFKKPIPVITQESKSKKEKK